MKTHCQSGVVVDSMSSTSNRGAMFARLLPHVTSRPSIIFNVIVIQAPHFLPRSSGTARCFVSLTISPSHSRSLKVIRNLGTVSYSPSMVTVVLSCIISEIKRDIGPKSRFFHNPCIRRSRYGGPRRNFVIPFGVDCGKTGYPMVKKV